MRKPLAAAAAFLLILALLPIALAVLIGRAGERGLRLIERAMGRLERWAGLDGLVP